MTKELAKRVQYERLANGTDVYVLKTTTRDVVVCKMAFSGGVYATYDKQSIVLLLDDLVPGGTKKMKRDTVLEKLELFGANVSVHSADGHFEVTLTSRSAVFLEAFAVVVEVLSTASFPQNEFEEAQARLSNSFTHALENTRLQANIALLQSLYRKGHPHWSPSTATLRKELHTITREDIYRFYTETFSSVGSLICIVGDVHPDAIVKSVSEYAKNLPATAPTREPDLHVTRTQNSEVRDTIHPLRNKLSVDTLFALPVSMTRDHSAFDALRVGVHILGGSSSSRLFTKLRTEQNLTYGSYASLGGFSEGYPGYVTGLAIFPTEVFSKGRDVLKETVRMFVEKGVTKKELEERKEEMTGKFKVNLSTTSGTCATLFSTLYEKKPVSDIDAFVPRINALSLKDVNGVIHEYLDCDLVRTSASGSVDKEGVPLAQ